MIGILHQLMVAYSEILQEAPITTKAVTSAIVYTIGDILAQRSEGAKRIDRLRVLRSLLAGGLGHGPLSHVWYNWSEQLFEYLGWYTWHSIPAKVLCDQLTWSPFWNNVYILMIGLMSFETLDAIWKDIRRTTVPLIVSGLKLWPAVDCVTYGLIPVRHRLLWVDMVEIAWVTILATQAAASKQLHHEKVSVGNKAAHHATASMPHEEEEDGYECDKSVGKGIGHSMDLTHRHAKRHPSHNVGVDQNDEKENCESNTEKKGAGHATELAHRHGKRPQQQQHRL